MNTDTIYDPPSPIATSESARPEKGSSDGRIDDFDARIPN